MVTSEEGGSSMLILIDANPTKYQIPEYSIGLCHACSAVLVPVIVIVIVICHVVILCVVGAELTGYNTSSCTLAYSKLTEGAHIAFGAI